MKKMHIIHCKKCNTEYGTSTPYKSKCPNCGNINIKTSNELEYEELMQAKKEMDELRRANDNSIANGETYEPVKDKKETLIIKIMFVVIAIIVILKEINII